MDKPDNITVALERVKVAIGNLDPFNQGGATTCPISGIKTDSTTAANTVLAAAMADLTEFVEGTARSNEALLYENLTAFTGYVENGSSTTVTLFHDDAVQRSERYHIKVGNNTYWGGSFAECIQKAVAKDEHIRE